MSEKRTFKISGMRCTACSGNVEKRLKKLEGVKAVEVSFATSECFISADSKLVPDELIISTVAKLGFQAAAVKSEAVFQTEHEDDSQGKKLLILSAASTILLMAVSMTHFICGTANTVLQLLFISMVLFAGRKFFTRGIPALFHGAPDMDTLIAFGSGASVVYSVFCIIFGRAGHLYFDSGAMIITLVMTGKYIESNVRHNALDAVKSLSQMIPETVSLVKNGVVQTVPASSVVRGDILQVVSGGRIPADGTITEGSGWIDESMFTGETLAVEKKCSDTVTGGTLCTGGTFRMKADSLGNDTVLAGIIRLVRQAQASKAPIARIADRVSGYFVYFVLTVAAITFCAHFFSGSGLETAFNFALATMVISCPCALGLATPVALAAGIGRGAVSGILIKSASVLELVCKIKCAAFDKTGTLTSNVPQFEKIFTFDGFDENILLANLVSAETGVGHPLAGAAAKEAEKRGLSAVAGVSCLEHFPGKGIRCIIEEKTWLFGSAKLLEENGVDVSALPDTGVFSTICISCGGKPAGVAAFSTELKKNAAKAVERLQKLGIRCVMLSGDRRIVAEYTAGKLQMNEVYADLLPREKLELSAKLKQNGVLAFVGDGVNDAPALAAADVSIAPGCASASAHDAADIVITGDDLLLVPQAVSLGRATMRVIKQNLFWAFFYNILAIPFASGAFYALFGGSVASPAVCAGAMAASSLTVVFNAVRLKGIKL